MLIDIHSHTFNASDISVREFIRKSRVTQGFFAELWYDLPKPLQDVVMSAFLKVADQGPPAAEERKELLVQLERLRSGAPRAGPESAPVMVAKSFDARRPAPDLDARARALLFAAFSPPAGKRPHMAAKAKRGPVMAMLDAPPRVPDEDAVYGLLVDYAFRSEPRRRGSPKSARHLRAGDVHAGDMLALRRWATPEQEAIYEWIPTVPRGAVNETSLDAEILTAWAAIEARSAGSPEAREHAIASKAAPGRQRSWIHRLVITARRWARKIGQTSKEAVVELARSLGRRIGAAIAKVRSLLELVDLLGSSRQKIVDTLSETYSQVQLFTPALVDYTAVTRDLPLSGLIDQVGFWEAYMEYRARSGAVTPLLHPFFPFDPYWLISSDYVARDYALLKEHLDAFESASIGQLDAMLRHRRLLSGRDPNLLLVMRYAIERAGFIGIKLYPPAKFAAYGNAEARRKKQFRELGDGKGLDLVLMALYRYCARKDVPILAHASAGNEFGKGYGALAGPTYWGLALDELKRRELPPLRLCLGHFGHFYHEQVSLGWGPGFARLMQEHQFVYGDVSNSEVPGSPGHGTRFVAELKKLIAGRAQLPSRLLYGSDWMLNTLHDGHKTFFDDFRTTFAGDQDLKAHLDAFLGRNAVRFLFLGADGRVNQNHQRICAFYTNVAGTGVPGILQAARLEAAHPQP
jgi:predicted TIM-barrel fold metal-dependent hydrolase